MPVFQLIRCLFQLIPFLMLSLLFVASYWFPSTKLPTMEADSSTTPPGSSVDKHCREQLIIYLLDHAVEIVNIFGWLWIRFYIASGVVRLVMDEILNPIVVFLARKVYGAFRQYWVPTDHLHPHPQ